MKRGIRITLLTLLVILAVGIVVDGGMNAVLSRVVLRRVNKVLASLPECDASCGDIQVGLLSGTASQFEVGFADGVVSITTGQPYTANGSELIVGADLSATAVPSAQTIRINGQTRGDLAVYNIGGNNFFKLRDLGDALGFGVDYDAASNTAVVRSAGSAPAGKTGPGEEI